MFDFFVDERVIASTKSGEEHVYNLNEYTSHMSLMLLLIRNSFGPGATSVRYVVRTSFFTLFRCTIFRPGVKVNERRLGLGFFDRNRIINIFYNRCLRRGSAFFNRTTAVRCVT